LSDLDYPEAAPWIFHRKRDTTGRPCLVCRREIGPTETEYEVGGAGVVMIAHEACYMLWREESLSSLGPRRP